MNPIKHIFLCFLNTLWLAIVFSIPADVEDISNRRYFPAVLEAIKKSETSIYMSLYYISYFPNRKNKVHALLNALVKAAKRGVKVEILLDRGFESPNSEDMSKKNIRAYSFLRKNGIEVYYDDIPTLTHAKTIIIDEKILISGSFNWSERSIENNREDALLVKSEEIAKQKLEEYKQIPKFLPEPVPNAIPIPKEFLKNREILLKMVKRKWPHVIRLAFLLLKKANEQNSRLIRLTWDEIVNDVFLNSPPKSQYKDPMKYFIHYYLRKYAKHYPEFFESYQLDEQTKDLLIELKFENPPKPDSLYLSKLFWIDGWVNRLSNKAIFCLLLVLDKTESGRMGHYFIQSQPEAEKEYGINHDAHSFGTTELQRYNLIDKDINYVPGEWNPNGFSLNDFYIYSDFEKKLKQLKHKTDSDLFQIVIQMSDHVNEPNDLNVYKTLIDLGKKYGLKVMKETLKVMKKPSSTASYYRRFYYVVGTIKRKGEEK